MKVCIMQPAYLPWLGFFHRMAICDLCVYLDSVPMDLSSRTRFVNRNLIRTRTGKYWLTVPLRHSGQDLRHCNIRHIRIAEDNQWRRKHALGIQRSYARAPWFSRYFPFFRETFSRDWDLLFDLLFETSEYLRRSIGISTPIVCSSELDVSGRKNELILNICRTVGGTEYVSGPFGKDYLDEESFGRAGIKITYHNYQHPSYPQVFPGFVSHLSIVDLLFNVGPGSKETIFSGNMGKI